MNRTLSELEKETALTDFKVVEVSKLASATVMILNPAFRIPTPRRVLGPAGRLANTSSGSSSGYSNRGVDRHILISRILTTRSCLFGGSRGCA